MFQSYKYLRSVDDGMAIYEYEIIDSDFSVVEWVSFEYEQNRDGRRGVGLTIIQEYEKRNLPVVPNLILGAKFLEKTYGDSIKGTLLFWDQYISEYQKYKKDLEKYLILL